MNDSQMNFMPHLRKQNPYRLWKDTILKNYALYYPKCKQETLIGSKDLQINVII